MTINNKSERNYRGKCLGWPVTSYGAGFYSWVFFYRHITLLQENNDRVREYRSVQYFNFITPILNKVS